MATQFKCNACGFEWNDSSTTHSCYGYSNSPPNATAIYSKLDRITELLEQQNILLGKTAVVQGRLVELLEHQNSLLERFFESKTFPAFDQVPGEIHYPLPGDPEPTTPSPFEPMTPDDQAAVERWRNAAEAGPSIGQALLTEFIVWLEERGYCKSASQKPANIVREFLKEKDSNG